MPESHPCIEERGSRTRRRACAHVEGRREQRGLSRPGAPNVGDTPPPQAGTHSSPTQVNRHWSRVDADAPDDAHGCLSVPHVRMTVTRGPAHGLLLPQRPRQHLPPASARWADSRGPGPFSETLRHTRAQSSHGGNPPSSSPWSLGGLWGQESERSSPNGSREQVGVRPAVGRGAGRWLRLEDVLDEGRERVCFLGCPPSWGSCQETRLSHLQEVAPWEVGVGLAPCRGPASVWAGGGNHECVLCVCESLFYKYVHLYLFRFHI